MLLELRARHKIGERPLIVWEPIPSSCSAQNRMKFVDACQLVDVFSPNHLEMEAVYEEQPSGQLNVENLKKYIRYFQNASIEPDGAGYVLVRAGTEGCVIKSRSMRPYWPPAFYQPGDQKVIDHTGAGNAFLGGFTAGLLQTGCPKEACHFGSVAATFALEQLGLPTRSVVDDVEQWNGVDVWTRLADYKTLLDPSSTC
jgi:sugar/nucleoside kinase (ribokinase family)